MQFTPGRPDMFNRYAYVANDPVNAIDPNGRETLFIGGAGRQGAYLEDFRRAFTEAGIKDVDVTVNPQSTARLAIDVLSVTSLNDAEYAARLDSLGIGRELAARSNAARANGDQFNLGGYSLGAAAAASGALATANNGGVVDNLILVGAPINADLLAAVSNNPNILNVIIVDLASQGDPISAGMSDAGIAGTLPTLFGQMQDNSGLFYFSGDNAEGARRRDELARELVDQGVK